MNEKWRRSANNLQSKQVKRALAMRPHKLPPPINHWRKLFQIRNNSHVTRNELELFNSQAVGSIRRTSAAGKNGKENTWKCNAIVWIKGKRMKKNIERAERQTKNEIIVLICRIKVKFVTQTRSSMCRMEWVHFCFARFSSVVLRLKFSLLLSDFTSSFFFFFSFFLKIQHSIVCNSDFRLSPRRSSSHTV